MRKLPDDPEMDAIRRQPPAFGLFAPPTETRHETAIASTEQSATPHETALVIRIQAQLRERHTFTADTVAELLNAAGVPRTLEVRRRLASRIVNGGKTAGDWTKAGKQMTEDNVRSGREIAVWNVVKRGP